MKKVSLLALSLFLAMPLAGCGKKMPDPPKQYTDDTCSNKYLEEFNPNLGKALREAEGNPPFENLFRPMNEHEYSFPDGAIDKGKEAEDKVALEHLQRFPKYIKYIKGCHNLEKKEHEEYVKRINDDASHVLEPVPNVTNITYPKPSKETCSNKYVNSHPELKKAIGYAFNQLLVEGKSTKKEVEKAEAEAKAKNFQDLDAIADLLKPKALGDFYKSCARYPD